MIVDEAVVSRLIYLQKAYPSKSDDNKYLSAEINKYFSKDAIEQRVSVLCKAMRDGKVSGKMLHKHYPLLLFFSKKYRGQRKIIFNKNLLPVDSFKDLCVDFGIPCHLKKHGSSDNQVFRLLPAFGLNLDEVKAGKESPLCGWNIIWEFLYTNSYFHYDLKSRRWIIYNSLLKMPNSFWTKALAQFELKDFIGSTLTKENLTTSSSAKGDIYVALGEKENPI